MSPDVDSAVVRRTAEVIREFARSAGALYWASALAERLAEAGLLTTETDVSE